VSPDEVHPMKAEDVVQNDAPRIPVLDWESKDGKLVRLVIAPGTRRPILEELLRVAKAQGCEVVEATDAEAAAIGEDKAAHLALGKAVGRKKFAKVAAEIGGATGPNRAERRAADRARRKGTR